MIGIICAMENEISFYKTILQNLTVKSINNHDFFIGTIEKNNIILSKCGIGKVNSAIITSLLIHNFSPKLIINTGIAGGVSLQTKDIFIGNEFIYGDFDLQIFGYDKGQVPGLETRFKASNKYLSLFDSYLNKNKISFKKGLIVTQDSFITSLDQLEYIDESIIATDMESASIAHTCNMLDTEFIAIRIISDVVNDNNQILDYKVFEDEAAELSSQVTYKFLLNTKL